MMICCDSFSDPSDEKRRVRRLACVSPFALFTGLLALGLLGLTMNVRADSCAEPSFFEIPEYDGINDPGFHIVMADFTGDGKLDFLQRAGTKTSTIIPGTGTGTFGKSVVIPHPPRTGASSSYSNILGDFDNDGKPDLISDRGGPLWLSTTDSNPLSPSVPPAISSIPDAVGDFNGDGNLDFAAVSQGGITLSLYLGHGDGTFESPVTLAAGQFPRAVSTGDFNRDGKLDLAVVNYPDRTLSILVGKGDGTFGPPASTHDQHFYDQPSIAVGDFNRDGKLDLAIVGSLFSDVFLLLGHGDGTFADLKEYRIVNIPTSIIAADLNRDGNLDIVAGGSGDSDSLSVLWGKGDGDFKQAETYVVGRYIHSVAAGDVNGDGIPDLLMESYLGSIYVLLGTSSGHFVAPASLETPASAFFTVDDFNEDGIPDIAAADVGGFVSVFMGKGDASFATPQNYSTENVPYNLASGDFNGDGHLDLAVGNYTNYDPTTKKFLPIHFSVLYGRGDGSFGKPNLYDAGLGYNDLAAGDFDGDGISDLAILSGQSKTLEIFHGSLSGSLVGPTPLMGGNLQAPWLMQKGDFNGDGRLDLAVAYNAAPASATVPVELPAKMAIFLQTQSGGFTPFSDYPIMGDDPFSIAVADWNGDHHLDLIVTARGDSRIKDDASGLSYLYGNGDGSFTFSESDSHKGQFYDYDYKVAVADYNGDGIPDLTITGELSDVVSISQGNGGGSMVQPKFFTVEGGYLLPRIADLNGDGKPDLAVGGHGISILVNTCGSPSYGDLNSDGQVSLADLMRLLKLFIGLDSPTAQELAAADVRPKPGKDGRSVGDGHVGGDDLSWLLRRYMGLTLYP